MRKPRLHVDEFASIQSELYECREKIRSTAIRTYPLEDASELNTALEECLRRLDEARRSLEFLAVRDFGIVRGVSAASPGDKTLKERGFVGATQAAALLDRSAGWIIKRDEVFKPLHTSRGRKVYRIEDLEPAMRHYEEAERKRRQRLRRKLFFGAED